jgi:hypothetical protein
MPIFITLYYQNIERPSRSSRKYRLYRPITLNFRPLYQLPIGSLYLSSTIQTNPVFVIYSFEQFIISNVLPNFLLASINKSNHSTKAGLQVLLSDLILNTKSIYSIQPPGFVHLAKSAKLKSICFEGILEQTCRSGYTDLASFLYYQSDRRSESSRNC